jgi:hypothetical protein
MPPGAHLGMDLVLWLSTAVLISFEVLDLTWLNPRSYYGDSSDLLRIAIKSTQIAVAGAVMMGLLLWVTPSLAHLLAVSFCRHVHANIDWHRILHFGLFVRACIETRQRAVMDARRPVRLVPFTKGSLPSNEAATVAIKDEH